MKVRLMATNLSNLRSSVVFWIQENDPKPSLPSKAHLLPLHFLFLKLIMARTAQEGAADRVEHLCFLW